MLDMRTLHSLGWTEIGLRPVLALVHQRAEMQCSRCQHESPPQTRSVWPGSAVRRNTHTAERVAVPTLFERFVA